MPESLPVEPIHSPRSLIDVGTIDDVVLVATRDRVFAAAICMLVPRPSRVMMVERATRVDDDVVSGPVEETVVEEETADVAGRIARAPVPVAASVAFADWTRNCPLLAEILTVEALKL